MTPIEAMAKARHDRQCRDKRGRLKISWENNFPEYREHWIKEAAADLLALAECDLPAELFDAATQAETDVRNSKKLERRFKFLLRSIANGGGNMCQAGSTAACEPVSASPLQSGDGGEAKWRPMETAPRPVVKHWGDAPLILARTKRAYADPVLVRWLDHDNLWLTSGGAGLRDEDLIGWLPLPLAQSSDEEAHRADTDGTASPDASLTHKT